MTKESIWRKMTNGLKSEHKLPIEKMLDNQIKYSNRIRNRLFALEVKICEVNPLVRVNINNIDGTISIDGKLTFEDFKKISKYVTKIQIILNRNRYENKI